LSVFIMAPSIANAMITVSISNEGQNEDSGNMTFTVTITAGTVVGPARRFDYATVDGSATTGDGDYVSTTGDVRFGNGKTVGDFETFDVPITGDTKVEADETFTVTLTPQHGTDSVTGSPATGTINNDDSATVSIAANDAAAAEPADDGQFTVTMTNPSDTDTVISYNVTGDATAGSDYTSLSGSVTVLANATTATIDVAVIDENLVEDNETVTVTLDSIASGYAQITIGVPNSDTVTISDDDTATFTINDVSVNESAGTMDVTVSTVSLDKALDIPVVVDVSYADVTATGGGTDYDSAADTANFAAGSTVAQTVTVAITDDNLVEATETFTASLSTATALGTRSTDFSDTGTGTINDDNDTATFTINDVSVNESAGTYGIS